MCGHKAMTREAKKSNPGKIQRVKIQKSIVVHSKGIVGAGDGQDPKKVHGGITSKEHLVGTSGRVLGPVRMRRIEIPSYGGTR